MNLTHADVKTILEIVDKAEHLDEIELVFAGLKLHVRRSAGEPVARASQPLARSAAPAAPAAALQPAASASARGALAPNEVALRAPMLGTFYRAASPGDAPFVEVGQRVKAQDSVGVIEVMKLFNTICAGVDGTVVRIEAQNATLVEFDQPLVIIARD
ncbi:MAG TPA: biotin/lipoyl-containing protein [Ramlibacter sp.]|nr:biotin/lipoyl-containing protein [Ramlibacter sp.]